MAVLNNSFDGQMPIGVRVPWNQTHSHPHQSAFLKLSRILSSYLLILNDPLIFFSFSNSILESNQSSFGGIFK